MRRLRDLICALAFVILTAVSIWAAVQAAQQDFPDSAALEPVDLRQWLTDGDLSQTNAAARSRLARRFEEELRGGEAVQWAKELRSLDPGDAARLEENLSAVLEFWYRDKVNRYFDQRPERRAAWLDREIEHLERVFKGSRGRNEPPLGGAGALFVMGRAGVHMDQWISRADPPMQEKMREFQGAVLERMMARKPK